ncbi:hypothetical protein Nepgr_018193 [Nepenthes gracilis]|uniref:protein-serine/threonine phosphatase n=1 Tax=Nepenthes gracilis TaxID=150966 RepID=A0AAD3STN3_NEPGR|nr:hypothetical protein Nepgr_018193 [Nepenthes gracilis]
MAVVQANNLLEDHSQIESDSLSNLDSGPFGTFAGIYDGHGGPETSLRNKEGYSGNNRRFFSVVSRQWSLKAQIAAAGLRCLVRVICSGVLYIANVGDPRIFLEKLVRATGEALSIQLSTEHNACIESMRQELQSLHPYNSQIVVLKHNVWHVKGLIQVSRSIGDVYLKMAEYNREPLYAKFHLNEPFQRPILSLELAISVHELQLDDQFIIFASDGLWEHLSNQEVVDIIQRSLLNVRFSW